MQNHKHAAESAATVYIVDDDEAVRALTAAMLEDAGLTCVTAASASAFLELERADVPSCLLTDVRMQGLSGIELLEVLRGRGDRLPVILMTSFADVSLAVRSMRAGACDLLQKPLDERELVERVRAALARGRTEWEESRRASDARDRLSRLSPRQAQVLHGILAGHLNKQIASDLGISIKTVELHRSQLMERLDAASVADLVRVAVWADESAASGPQVSRGSSSQNVVP